MYKKLLVFVPALIALLMVSCSDKGGKTGLPVPKEAVVVLHINTASLSSKLSWNEIRASEWFKKLESNTTDSTAQLLLTDPAASGVNTSADLVLFLARKGRSSYMAFGGGVSDAAALEKTIRENAEEEVEVVTEGDVKLALKSGGRTGVLAWTTSRFIAVENAYFDGAGNQWSLPGATWGNSLQLLSRDSIALLCKEILSLKGDQLLDKDKRFASLIAEPGDVHFWSHNGSLLMNSVGIYASMMKVSALLEDNITASSLSFEDGKITAKATQYFGEEMTALLKKHTPKTISNDVVNRLPSGKALMAGVFNYPPEGLQAMIKMIGFDGMANGFLSEFNFSIEEFVRANKGDIAFAVTSLGMKRDSISYEGINGKREYFVADRPDVGFVAGIGVNNKESFGKLIALLQREVGPTDEAMPGVEYSFTDNWFTAGSQKSQIDAFNTGGNAPEYASHFTGHHLGYYIDLKGLLSASKGFNVSGTDEPESRSTKALNLSASFWNNVIIHGDVKNGRFISSIEVNLSDNSTNSLKQLNNYLGELSNYLAPDDAEDWRHDAPGLKDKPVRVVPVPPATTGLPKK